MTGIARVPAPPTDPREETSKSGGYGPGDVPGNHEVAAPEMLAEDHAVTDPVIDVEAIQLLLSAPVVVPDDEIGLVPDALSGSQPAVGEVVVLRSRLNPAVKATELEKNRTVNRHRLRVQDKRDLAGILARDRVVLG